ncbi:MAG: DUF2889 domain-containing protein [Burkholderiales bacterium]|nr:DUF2889 domain-containing protein [Burkholderiales bacterium]
MPLPASPHRTELHLRRIEMRGYRRDDGFYEIDGRVTDTKTHDLTTPSGTQVAATREIVRLRWPAHYRDERER